MYGLKYIKDRMEKKCCIICNQSLDIDKFYGNKSNRSHNKCKICYNRIRRESKPELKCMFCKQDFRPKAQGQYIFCSEKCRFLAKVDKSTANGCWIWKGGKMRRGYGIFTPADGRKSALAHREAYRILVGPLDATKFIIHSCDNTRCVNPSHLRVGSAKDNYDDAKAKGRITDNHLSENQVLNIRKLYYEGTSPEVLAKIYKRNIGTIQDIVCRVTWGNI